MTPSAHRRLSPVVRWLCILLSLLVLSLTACPIDEGIDGGGGGGSGGGGGGGVAGMMVEPTRLQSRRLPSSSPLQTCPV